MDNMRLAKIEHFRCSEYDCTTYIGIPDNMTLEEFKEKVRLAEADYHAFVDEWTALGKDIPYPGNSPQYAKYPDKTVTEVNAEWELKKAPYEAFQRKRDEAKQSFGH